MLPASFDTAVRAWFEARFDAPTACQSRAWAALARSSNTLVAAPTGSGKTLAAFLTAIDELVGELRAGTLENETRVLYVSPLKALSNDVQRNLEEPLTGITAALRAERGNCGTITTAVRTGDTPAAARTLMRKRPPHILVTTPESLYILLTSEGGRDMLRTVRSVIVDEIHALVGNKRGAHLALSLARLEHLTARPLLRIGLSATQRPIERVAEFLVGARPARVHDHRRGARPRARPRHRDAALAARDGAFGRSRRGNARAHGRADPRTPHDAGVRQHPAHGRAPGACAGRPPG